MTSFSSIGQLSVGERELLLKAARDAKLARRSPESMPITRAERTDVAPLSFAQQRLWFLSQLEGAAHAYHVSGSLRLHGVLDDSALQSAFARIVDRHEALRTVIEMQDGEPVQRVLAADPARLGWEQRDLRAESAAEVERVAIAASREPFDLARGPLVRCTLLRTADVTHVLVITMHHIVADGVSIAVFCRELAALYAARRRGEADVLPPLSIQYADYAVWQHRELTQSMWQSQAEYWQRALSGAPLLLELPTDRPRPAEQDFAGDAVSFELDVTLTSELKRWAQRHGATMFQTLLTGWASLLGRYSGQPELVVGIPSANRQRPELEDLIGFFVNTLAVRVHVAEQPSVAALLQHVRGRVLEAQANQELPFERVVELVNPTRNLAHSPLFQVMFAWLGDAAPHWELPGLSVEPPVAASSQSSKFDLTLSLEERDGRVTGGLEYATALFDHGSVVRLLDSFRLVLAAMVADDSQSIEQLPLLTSAERQRVLEAFNATTTEYPSTQLVHELIEAQVRKNPDAVALRYRDESLSYGELNALANRLAHQLRTLGVEPDSRVAVCAERGPGLVAAVLAVLKAGGAYVPLDPAYPVDRLRHMLDDSQSVALVCDDASLVAQLSAEVPQLYLNRALQQGPSGDLPRVAGQTSRSLAYVIYTSGSTGTPKGVMVEHRGVVNFLESMRDMLQVEPRDRVLGLTTISFDIAGLELYLPLVSGASIALVERADAGDPEALAERIERLGASIVQATPATWRALAESGWRGGQQIQALCGGEALSAELAARIRSRVGELWNVYGPTETTVWSTAARIERADSMRPQQSIGQPIANTRVYVLDARGEPVPVGVTGELYIGGDGVARGYHRRPELTAERFLPDPFADAPDARMYKTGDLARHRADGSLEFLGRNDFQVKIRGFRIELGEIEAALLTHVDVRAAVVVAREDAPGDKRLVAYFTSGSELGAEALRAHLAERLPDHMLPSACVRLATFPLTPNGKLNRNALPAPGARDTAAAAAVYVPALPGIETRLAELWGELLKVERVGRFDNFFELGGHSLLAVKLVERLRGLGLNAGVKTVFAAPTLAQLSTAVEAPLAESPSYEIPAGTTALTPEMLPLVSLTPLELERIVASVPGGAVNVEDIYPLTPLQEGILFHHLSQTTGDTYLLATALSFATRQQLEDFAQGLNASIARHPALRSAIAWLGVSRPVQVVWRNAELRLLELPVAPDEDAFERLWELRGPERQRLDLSVAPLLQLHFAFDAARGRWCALLLWHHLIGDHTTLDVLGQELQAHLAGKLHELPPASRYRDLVASACRPERLPAAERFFETMLGEVTEPTAPFGLLDVRREPASVQRAVRCLPLAVALRLRERARVLRVSMASLCHEAFALVLSGLTGQERVSFGTVLSGRSDARDVTRSIGLFVNTLPVVLELARGSCEASVRATHSLLTELLVHEHAPLTLARRTSKLAATLPLFTTLLNYRHSPRKPAEHSTMELWPGIEVLATEERTNYPLTLSVDDHGDELSLSCLADHAIGAERVCELMVTALTRLNDALERSPDLAIGELDVMPDAERQLLLESWSGASAGLPEDLGIHQLFSEQVRCTPDAVALEQRGRRVSYAELEERANALAAELHRLGVVFGDRVALELPRSLELVASQLAVLKLGAAYVPVDPAAPSERRAFMIEDCGAKVLLALSTASVPVSQHVVRLDVDRVPVRADAAPVTVAVSRDALAYVMYTSGSTGTPKGAMIPHRGVVRLVRDNRFADFLPTDRVAFAANPAFDAATLEVWAPLLNGGRIVVVEQAALLAPRSLGETLREHGVTVLWLTVGLFNRYVDELYADLGRLRYLFVGGDALDPRAIAKLLQRGAPRHLLNGYGPTETTTFAVTHEIASVSPDARSIPLGRPIGNTSIYVLDARHRPVLLGATGEIYIGGAGVALGYLNRPELTAERFVADPFSAVPGALLYKTGDLARFNADGTLEFLGRNDFQVKIRGFRVELGEIEARLLEIHGVQQALVLAREDQPGDKRLVAYLCCEGEPDVEQLRTALSVVLPEYMVPSAFVGLRAFPLTPNGKVDRAALPAPDQAAYASGEYEAPATGVERVLATLWSALLQVERIGRNDDFFQLGGHSLLTVQLSSRVRETWGVEVPVLTLFTHRTLRELAVAIERAPVAELPPVRPLPRPAQLPLSLSQQRLWFLAQVGGAGDAYHISIGLRLCGRLNHDALRRALHRIVVRHESLRTTFAQVDGQPAQRVADVSQAAFVLVERSVVDGADARRLAEEAALAPFDLERGPLLRGLLLREAEERYALHITLHHIIADGWSTKVLVQELAALYESYASGAPESLPEPELQFADYALWEQRWLGRELIGKQGAYWQAALSDAPTLLELPLDRPRPPRQDHSGSLEALQLDADLTRELQALAARQGVTLFMILLAGWAALLSRLSGQSQVVIGSPSANRRGRELEPLIGFFVNTLPLRLGPAGVTVCELLAQAKERTLEAQANQDIPFDHIVEQLNPPRSPAHSPLFQVMFGWQGEDETRRLQLSDLALEAVDEVSAARSKVDLTLFLRLVDDRIEGALEYATALFDASTVRRFACYYARLLRSMVQSPDELIERLPLLPESERALLVQGWNATTRAVPAESLHAQFELQARRNPEAVAVIEEERSISYAALDAWASAVATRLVALGVQAGDRVALCLPRSIELVVAELGVLKAGAAYVPLDSELPLERQAFMFRDSGASVLVTERSGDVFGLGEQHQLAIAELPTDAVTTFSVPTSADAPAYVMYTSGSTGVPKGVVVPHRGVTRLVIDNGYAAFDVSDRVAFAANPSFDATTMEVWAPLLNGGAIIVIDKATFLDPLRLTAALRSKRVTALFVTTAIFNQCAAVAADGFSGLRYLMTGGERCDPAAFARVLRAGAPQHLIHCYGPTEATTFATTFEVASVPDGAETLPIGRPIGNTQIYILGAGLCPVPRGVTGEIYIGGPGVALGYLNRPELTAERFVKDPFSAAADARLYKTGDLARWLEDGNVEFVGRHDFQVKLRGFRIELGEIEARLLELDGVREAVVLAREDAPGVKRLVAYFTSAGSIAADDLRAHLRESLPEYMVPSALVELSALPLTPSGKIDRKALPAPTDDALATHPYAEPVTPAERTIARVWSELLSVEQVGRHDNFFELGGHSLLAVTLIEKLRAAGLQADVRAIFAARDLAELAATTTAAPLLELEVPPNLIPLGCAHISPDMLPLADLTANELERCIAAIPGGAANVQDIYALAPLQAGILFHYLSGEAGDPYLLASQLSFGSRERLEQFTAALRVVIGRHDILRTSLAWEGLTEPVQVVWREAPLDVKEVVLGDVPDAAAELRRQFDPRTFRLDLRQAPLICLRFAFDGATQRWLLLVLWHHVIGDHTTLDIMQAEIEAVLRAEIAALPAPIPYRNLVAHTRSGLSQAEHEAFFRSHLADVTEPTAPYGVLDVQGDGRGTEQQRRELDAELCRRLRARSRALGVSAASLHHLAWALVLSRLTGQRAVVFGTVLFGRMAGGAGSERAIGLFMNTLPLRLQVYGVGCETAARHAQQMLAELLRHEHAALALAQRCSGVAAPAPLFTSILNYRHSAAGVDPGENLHGWSGISGVFFEERTNYPLSVDVDDLGEGFAVTAQTIAPISADRVCALFEAALGGLVTALEQEPERPLDELTLMPQSEQSLLERWNDTERSLQLELCVHEHFERVAARAPEAVAIATRAERVTYAQLNARANQLARFLRKKGLESEQRVGLCVARGIEQLVGMLAIWKAGGCYVPLDADYPRDRLAHLISDSNPQLLLADRSGVAALAAFAVPCIDLESEAAEWADQARSNLPCGELGVGPRSLAYIIYTSGSTGMPKGVMIEHENLVNYALDAVRWFGLRADDQVLQQNSLNFDLSLEEIVPALLAGATLLPSSGLFGLGDEAASAAQPTVVHLTAAHLHLLLGEWSPPSARRWLAGLRLVNVTGDALSVQKLERWDAVRPASLQLINTYGPTETAISCTAAYVSHRPGEKTVTIGRPFANTRIHILDEKLRPVPVGAVGELYVAGRQVGRGYLNRPELTNERFVSDPFSQQTGARMYRTGDLARWQSTGNIEFLGRADSQVKVRGFRIELGEIESFLSSLGGIKDAAVLVHQDGTEKQLVAYYTARHAGSAPDAQALRDAAERALPEYLRPAAYVLLERLPLTPNGKLDRKALQALAVSVSTARDLAPPRGDIEQTLAEIWAELLKLERVGRHDNFFALGGHSLLAVALSERLRLRGLTADVRAIFGARTLAQLAEVTRKSAAADAGAIAPNLIPLGCRKLTPDLLPLVKLTQVELDRVVDSVPGGAENVQDVYPLAPLQEGILFHHLMSNEGDAYLELLQLGFDRQDRLDAFLAALRLVIARHDVLRTAVLWEDLPEPLQVVWREAPLHVETVELAEAEDAAVVLRQRFDPRHYRIDLRQAPLLRVFKAWDRARQRWLLLILSHHLIGDHTAQDVLQSEVQAHLLGRAAELPPPTLFREFVAEARLRHDQPAHDEFFARLLGDISESTAPFGLTNVQGDGSGIAEARVELAPNLAQRLRERSRRLGVSCASVCHLAWALVLARVTGRKDVVLGTVLFGRMRGGAGATRGLGLFMNTLPVRFTVDARGTEDAVKLAQSLLAELMEHEHASLALAQRCSGVAQPAPLFTSLLNYRHVSSTPPSAAELGWDGVEQFAGEERTNYPLTLCVDDQGDGLALTAQVQQSVDARRVCDFMQCALEALLDALEHTPGAALASLDVLPATERAQVLETFNRTEQELGPDVCVHELFAAQVARTPDATAVSYAGESLTYRELNVRANRLGHALRELGVGAESLVAICAERSVELVVGLLGILKAGGAYVPLDPSYPRERLSYMLRDSGATVLLTQAGVAVGLGAEQPSLVQVSLAESFQEQPEYELAAGRSDSLAYVIYTSGSTGQPKGAMNEHRAVVNRLRWMQSVFKLTSTDVVLQKTPFGFDVSVWEFFWPLMSGACLVLAKPEGHKDPSYLCGLIAEAGVTTLHFVPSMLQVFLEHAGVESCGSLRQVMCSGEALPLAAVTRFFERLPGVELHNLYGPTEAAVDVTWAACHAGMSVVPIGKPIANTQMYVLDEALAPLPVGVAGELYIGGVQVGRGYLGRPELTAERFLANPYASGRLYKTGDLARWLPDGQLEYLGRNDFQVKLRGFRIELPEIEARLLQHGEVREAVVVARQDGSGDTRLVAYLVAEQVLSTEVLRAHLASSLPEYMVPSAFVQLESMPLSPNGKLDRKALPEPGADAFGAREFEAPQGNAEVLLADIWCELLGVERVGRQDNFFELGGHSLLAISMIERLRSAGLAADVQAVFAASTLAALAASTVQQGQRELPSNPIPPGCERITPELLNLVALSQTEIDRVVALVDGGAANVQDIYPLAPLQEGIFFHHLVSKQGDAYLTPYLAAFDSRQRIDDVLRGLQAVVDRHDILRTSMAWEGLSQPVQVVWRHAPVDAVEVTLDPHAGDRSQQLLGRFHPSAYRIDLRTAPMFRIFVAYDDVNQRWLLLLLLHHLADDNTTLKLVFQEIEQVLLGRAAQLPQAVPFRNFVAQALLGVSREEHETFFRGMLAEVSEPTAPFGLLDVQGQGRRVLIARREVEPQVALAGRAQARRLGVSMATLCHQAWAMALARLTGQSDVVFGTVLSGRLQGVTGSERGLGVFINTLPLRLTVDESGAETSVRRTHSRLAELLRHEHASLVLAQRMSGVQAPAPLFTALLNYRQEPGAVAETAEAQQAWSGISEFFTEERTNYPVSITVDESPEKLTLTAHVDAAVDPSRVVGLMHQALAGLVEAISEKPATALCHVEVLPLAERRLVLETWNQTRAEYPADLCIQQLFEAQVERTPQQPALEHRGRRLSYRELNARANRLARRLRALGVGPDQRVAVCLPRGVELVVGLLAVLKAGGAYVPLDPAYPVERLRYLLEDSTPMAIVTQPGVAALPESRIPRIDPLEDDEDDAALDTAPGALGLSSRHLAYVIYTSGSTGKPKGVMIEHGNAVNFLSWARREFSLEQLERTLFSTSINFDLAVFELFTPLSLGAMVVLVDDALALAQQQHDVTLVNTVPSAMRMLLDAAGVPDSVGTVNLAGEALKRELVEGIFAQTAVQEVCNLYGPSETTTYSTWVRMPRSTGFAASIGRPVANTQIYILDARRNPVPVGAIGEIYIGGAGVARGYLDRPELTAERFLPDPFSAVAGARMYRTGDLARWLGTGDIEYLGRNDHQVKIRGFRIELGEVESRLTEYPGVRQCVVTARDDGQTTRLVAYVVGSEELSLAELRAHLGTRLPEHMVPSAFVQLAALPLTPNGKLDRGALPAPDTGAFSAQAYEAPQGELEETLARIFSEVLRVDRVGRHDDFFELGGHSLLTVQVVSRLRSELGLEVPLAELFENPTLNAFARVVVSARRAELPPIARAARNAPLPLSFAQQRLWFLAQIEGVSRAYHVSGGLRLRGKLDVPALRRALDELLARHEALRTTFALLDGSPVQCVVPAESARFVLQEHTVTDEAALLESLQAEADLAFDLEHGPLVRGRLIHRGEGDHTLLITMHHIVSDGWSMGVLMRDLNALYRHQRGESEPLQPLALQYADYAVWQRGFFGGGLLEQQARYWRDALAGAPLLLELPADRPRPAQQDFSGDALDLELGAELTSQLGALARRHGATLFMTLLAGWAALLGRLSGQSDLVIGTPSANRSRPELEGLIGFFVSTLPVRLELELAGNVAGLIGQVKQRVLAAQANQDIPFEQIVELVNPVRSLAHAPLVQVVFAWQNQSDAPETLGGLRSEPLAGSGPSLAKFDVTLSLGESDGQVRGALEYASALFDRDNAQRMLGYYRALLQGMVADDGQALEGLPLLAEAEEHQLLRAWNGTHAQLPDAQGIHELFEAQVRRSPEAIALVEGDRQLSYAQLDGRANWLALQLRGLGVCPGDCVALCVERSTDLVVAELAILKAGAAYVPLDPSFPVERRALLLRDCAARCLLTTSAVDFSTWPPPARLDLDRLSWDTSAQGVSVPGASDALAYVMYTSGSTGTPKGVMVPHRGVVRLVIQCGYASFGPDDRVAFAANPAFDATTLEVWAPLLNGGTCVIFSQDSVLDPARFGRELALHGVTVLWLTVGLFNRYVEHLADAFAQLRYLIVGGDALDPRTIARLLAHGRPQHLLNGYGPTETTTFAITHEITEVAETARSIPLGRPIGNTQVYLLDPGGRPVPVGVSGEIYIGGLGVGLGYLNRPELTAERFVPDRFGGTPGGSLYRSGDLGRWRPDGTIEFLGRNDHQVKVRGFRIELGEIEAALAAWPGVREVAVIAREASPGEKRLVAYVATDAELDVEALRAHLVARLPDYMVPGAYVQLATLPLTSNGKVDRRALPAPDADAYASRDYESPTGPAEMELARIWAELLGIERVGRNDNFFELGGHSLMAVSLIDRLRKSGLHLDVRALFSAPTLAELAKQLGGPSTEVEVPHNPIADVSQLKTGSSKGKVRL